MKKFLIVFIVICVSVLAVPLVFMMFRPTVESTDNRKMASFPNVTTAEGAVNTGFFSGFENWFNDHFAFRNELIYADARIQNDIFKVSNVENVISGKEGWLFYTSTLKDYLGNDRLSDREIYNIAHNLSLAYDYIKDRNSNFVLTIPANKNTLYGEYMPYYYSYVVDSTHNTDALKPLLEEKGIPYADLINSFKNEAEILYMKTDSHWNNKGAVLAYNTIMDTLGVSHDDYSGAESKERSEETGDLSRMMYTFYGKKEGNYIFNIEPNYEYQGNFKSVEDGRIETKGQGENGKLLMFRDSFGNTLVPLIANCFSEGFFTRENLYSLEKYIEEKKPDTVIFEKVERNLEEFITMPPIISAPVYEGSETVSQEGAELETDDGLDISVKTLESDTNYYEISGSLYPDMYKTNTDILIKINGKTYRAYHIKDNGFAVYLKKESVTFPAETEILVKDESIKSVKTKTFNINSIQ